MPTTTLFCRPSSAPATPDRTSQTAPTAPTKTPNRPKHSEKNTPCPAGNNIATRLHIRRQYHNQTAPPSTTRQPARTPTTTLFCRPSSAPAAPDRTSQTAPDRLTKTPRAPPATISQSTAPSRYRQNTPLTNGLFNIFIRFIFYSAYIVIPLFCANVHTTLKVNFTPFAH